MGKALLLLFSKMADFQAHFRGKQPQSKRDFYESLTCFQLYLTFPKWGNRDCNFNVLLGG